MRFPGRHRPTPRLREILLGMVLLAAALAPAAARAAPALPAGAPLLLVDDPSALAALEAKGFSLAAVLGAAGDDSTAALAAASQAFRTLAETAVADIAELRAEMAGKGIRLFEVTDGNVGRVLDGRWLASPIARFRLVGVVNRLDRQDFANVDAPGASCGEVRLVYRLAYRFMRGDTVYSSRLPVALNVVLAAPGGDCAALARAFVPAAAVEGTEAVAGWLAAGPLAPARLALKQIELNAQIVRFPSGLETEFGGEALYLMRIFTARREAGGLALMPRPLENTPDVARIAADQALKARLLAYVRDNLAAIDAGVFQVPDDLLAVKALSVSTYGSARLGNRPFARLIAPADLDGLDLAGLAVTRSPAGLIERLDQSSCAGCHQSGGTAGFHLVGTDDGETSPLNVVAVGVSPHLAAELPRRGAYLAALVAGRAPNPFRPLAAAPPGAWGEAGPPTYRAATAGMICLPAAGAAGLGGGWPCAAGLACTVIAENAALALPMGQCMPPADRTFSGLACLAGAVGDGAAPYEDRFRVTAQISSFAPRASPTGYTCRPPKGGTPGGLAYRQCDGRDKTFAGFRDGRTADEICAVAGGKAFDTCVATNNFADCLAASVLRGNRASCDADRLCREDFMCQTLPADVPDAARVRDRVGFCSPTYFLFQMRLDGHPDPLRGLD